MSSKYDIAHDIGSLDTGQIALVTKCNKLIILNKFFPFKSFVYIYWLR